MTVTAMGGHAARTRITKRKRRAALIVAGAITVVAGGLIATGMVAKMRLAAAHPPPGQMVDVGGYRLHLHCTGAGPQTVLLEAGNADFSVHWARVQPGIAGFARVCSYDRAGLGWSEAGDAAPTAGQRVEDLGRLLAAAGIDGPLILVGHSYGGVLARLFADRHPGRVAGMVLVDAAHPGQMGRLRGLDAAVVTGASQFRSLVPLARFGVLALMPGSVPNPGLPEAAQSAYAAVLATTGSFATAAAETEALPASLAASGKTLGRLGEMPLVVISRGRTAAGDPPDEADPLETGWRTLQADLANLSANTRHIVAAGSGHYVQLDQPQLVVDAVAGLIGRQ